MFAGCQWLPLTVGLCDVGGFENLPPGTAAQLKNKCPIKKLIMKIRTKS
jgi:hypothetical protein